jgi:hypothetical protein
VALMFVASLACCGNHRFKTTAPDRYVVSCSTGIVEPLSTRLVNVYVPGLTSGVGSLAAVSPCQHRS